MKRAGENIGSHGTDELRDHGNENPDTALTIAGVPGHGRFFLTNEAVEMVGVFGGALHCYTAPADAGSKACSSPGPCPAIFSGANCGPEGQTKVF